MVDDEAGPDYEAIRRRTLLGILALGAKGGLGRLVNMASLLLLARLLSPAVFGTFALIQLPAMWFNLLADAGVSGALVQAETLSSRSEQSGFTLRLLLAACAGALQLLLAESLGGFYTLSAEGIAALRLLAVGPLISALGTVPGVRLTRDLRFDRLSLAEAGSLVAGQLTAVLLAYQGHGLWSLVAGSLATMFAGTLLVNVFSPWLPRLLLSPGRMAALLQYGVKYQGQGVAHLVKDQLVPALGGRFFGKAQLGQLSWAVDIARWPRLPADIVARVGFPAFSRLQRKPESLARLAGEAIFVVTAVSFVAAALGIVLSPRLVPRFFDSQWVPAVPFLQLLLLQTPFDALAAVLLPLIYATGDATKGLRLSATWAMVAWAMGVALLMLWPKPAALPVAIIFSTVTALVLIVRCLPPGISVTWKHTLFWPAATAVTVGGILHVLLAR